jgi:hypothetical protein
MKQYLSIILLPVILVASIFVAGFVANYQVSRSNHQWCTLINLLATSPKPPKSNLHAYRVYVGIVQRKQTLGCLT